MKIKKRDALIAASVAGLMAVSMSSPLQSAFAGEELVPCYGINACKGSGACGGAGNACAGQNECAGHGFVKVPKDACTQIKDGRLEPNKA